MAAFISAALVTRRITTPNIPGGGSWVVISVTAAPRSRAASATAKPILPVEWLPTKRTGSMASRVPPAVTITCLLRRSPACRPIKARVAATTSTGSIMRPSPSRPLASRPRAGPATSTPRARSFSTFCCTAALAYIRASIAGATAIGAAVASAVRVSIESPIPWASLASVVALAGATTNASARRPISTCSSEMTSVAHMSTATSPETRLRKVKAGAKRSALGVRATSTTAPQSSSRRAISKAL